MKKAGGIVALIAGIFGILAAILTLLLGGIGSALDVHNGQQVVGLGWGGILFSFLVIIFGAISISAKTKLPSVLLIISSLAGVVLGGAIVAIFMGLSLIGGLLALIGTKSLATSGVDDGIRQDDSVKPGPKFNKTYVIGTLVSLFLMAAVISAVYRNIEPKANVVAEPEVASAETVAASPDTVKPVNEVDICKSHKQDFIDSDYRISTVQNVGRFDYKKYEYETNRALYLDAKTLLIPPYPGTALEICSGETFLHNGSEKQYVYVISKLEDGDLHITAKDITEGMGAIEGTKRWIDAIKSGEEAKEKAKAAENNPQSTEADEIIDTETADEGEEEPEIVASFDCIRASNWVEKTICQDKELADLDFAMAETYKSKVAKFGEGAIKNKQLEWLKKRNACTDKQCIKYAYQFLPEPNIDGKSL